MLVVDLTGYVFGRWTVIGPLRSGSIKFWSCRCECGGEGHVRATQLVRGKSLSCGCAKNDLIRQKCAESRARRMLPVVPVINAMAPGWGDRRSNCLNYTECLDTFVRRHVGARNAQCPKTCARFEPEERHALLRLGDRHYEEAI